MLNCIPFSDQNERTVCIMDLRIIDSYVLTVVVYLLGAEVAQSV
jgi:hypothetical protein